MPRARTVAGPAAAVAAVIACVALAAQSPPEPKDKFVGALRQFLEAIAGQYGDEGNTSRAAIDSMELALADWDREIQADEAAASSQPRTAHLHGALGLIYLDRRRTEDALRELAQATRLDPARADIHTLRGFAYTLLDKPAEVTEAFAEAAALDPGDPTTSYRLAQHLARTGQPDRAARARQQFRDAQQKRAEQAAGGRISTSPFIRVDLLRQAANVAPIFPPALYADGFDALKQGRYAEAVTRFKAAAALDPLTVSGASTARTMDGAAALRQGQLTAALEQYRAAVESAPELAETHRLLGMAYWADEQFDQGIEQFKTAIRLRPDDERARVALADVLVAAGKLTEAEDAFKAAIRAVPFSGQAHYNLGRLYDVQQRQSDAAQMFQAAVNLNPLVGEDHLHQTIVRMYLSLPDFGRAIDAAAKRVDVNPNHADAHRALGDLYLSQGRHEEALTELIAALLIDPQSAEAYSAIAQVHLRTGRYPEAEGAARRALDIDPAHNAARYALATALLRVGRADEGTRELERFQRLQADARLQEQRGLEGRMLEQEVSASLARNDYETAIAALQKAVSVGPDNRSASLSLGVLLKNRGRHREALGHFNRALELRADPDVHRLLAETYQALGQLEASQTHRATYDRLKGERLRKAGWSR